MLYPGEEGRIQSKFEDFWIRVDDFKNLALSRHAAFMTQVARLETHLLDWVFGNKLFSEQSVAVSFACSIVALVATGIYELFHKSNIYDAPWLHRAVILFAVVFTFALIVGAAGIFLRKRTIMRRSVICAAVVCLAVFLTRNEDRPLNDVAFFLEYALAGFVCDVIYIALTRWLLRWAGEMTSTVKIAATVFLSCLVALLLVFPLLLVYFIPTYLPYREFQYLVLLKLVPVAVGNIVDAALSLLFVLLAGMLLIHRAVWPLLTRTLFRMADIGTKGRRAILTTVGFALLAAGVTGKVPELVQKLIEKLGG
jgi:hypothetical protein